jgi:hypothetical protein
MKIYIICFLLSLFIHPLKAQWDSTDLQFVHSVIRRYQPSGTIYYSNHAIPGVLRRQVKELSKQVVVNLSLPKDSIELTVTERKYLLEQLKDSANIELDDNLLPDSKRIEADSIMDFVYRANMRLRDTLKVLRHTIASVWYKVARSMYNAIYFTRPIYMRNRTILLFHFMWCTYGGGATSFCFYRKENDKWVKWVEVAGGNY